LPADIAAYKDATIKKKEEAAKASGKSFFDGQQVRMRNVGVRATGEAETDLQLLLQFGPGSYFTHASTGQILDQPILQDGNGSPTTIRQKYIADPYSWNDCLGNSIGVSAALVSTTDNALVYVRRSNKLTQYPDRFGVATAGFMDRSKDTVNGIPSPFSTLNREANEEMGVKEGEFRITGVGRPWDDLHAEIWGVLRTEMTVEQIMRTEKKDKYEALQILSVPFEPRRVMPILRNAGTKWVNAHAVATIDALLQDYNEEEVIAAAHGTIAA